ncbi:MAG TPA: hypothetical protein VFS33_05740 [Gemmatimonadales bacterium]|nr:hypothetical protein [Gemmatimonadales bacterium]
MSRSPHRERRVRQAKSRRVAARQARRARRRRVARRRVADQHWWRAVAARWAQWHPVWVRPASKADARTFDVVTRTLAEFRSTLRPRAWRLALIECDLDGQNPQIGVLGGRRRPLRVRLHAPETEISAAEQRVTAAALADRLCAAHGGRARAVPPTPEDLVDVLATGPRVLREWCVRRGLAQATPRVGRAAEAADAFDVERPAGGPAS